MIGYKIKIFSSAEEIKDFLNENAKNVFFSYGWFKTVESMNIKTKPYYICMYSYNKLVAVASCFTQYEELFETDTSSGILFGKTARIVNKLLNFIPSLVCYSPLSQSSGIIGKKNKEILDRILTEMKNTCKDNSIKCYCFTFVSDPEMVNLLKDSGLEKCYLFDKNILDIKNTFCEYKKSLSRNMRSNINREMTKAEMLGIKVRYANKIKGHAERLSELYNINYKKYFKKTSPLDASFFKSIEHHLKNKFVLFLAEKDESVIAFSLFFKDGQTLHAYKTGYDPKYRGLYFNVFYNFPIKYAIENKFKQINFGATLSNMKRRRGCKQTPVYAFFGFKNKLLGKFMRIYINLLDKKKRTFKPCT